MNIKSIIAVLGSMAALGSVVYFVKRRSANNEDSNASDISDTSAVPDSDTLSSQDKPVEPPVDSVVTPTENAERVVSEMVGPEEEVAVDSEIAETENKDSTVTE